MPDAWYYSTPDEQVGPITLQELKKTLPTLPNVKDVYIWHDSLPEWIRAGDLAEFVARRSASAQEASPYGINGNNGAHDAATTQPGVTPLDELLLEELHPDPTYAITGPGSSPEEPGNTPIPAKGRPVIGFLVGAILFLLGFGFFGLRLIGAIPRANSIFVLTGTLLLVAGLFVIWLRRSKAPAG